MKELQISGIELRTQQAMINEMLGAIEKLSRVETIRDEMANQIMSDIDSLVSVSLGKEEKHKKFHDSVMAYLEKEWVIGDGWKFVTQFINLAIIDTYHYESAILALPPNQKVLAFLMPRLNREFGVVFTDITKDRAKQLMTIEDYEVKVKPYYRENWHFYKLTLE